jgi:hypothetical protein
MSIQVPAPTRVGRADPGAWSAPSPRRFQEPIIAKNRNTFAKRQREQEKKQRADDKRAKRERKLAPPVSPLPTLPTRVE